MRRDRFEGYKPEYPETGYYSFTGDGARGVFPPEGAFPWPVKHKLKNSWDFVEESKAPFKRDRTPTWGMLTSNQQKRSETTRIARAVLGDRSIIHLSKPVFVPPKPPKGNLYKSWHGADI
ncbi:hypothetical protein CYMTET_44074 [Cymbomonas tetramitiformis]|uniref:Uncharacterized protein n=1 Tax=Cymbomonas tetramitiformis TaxID=36881 RepID=A0AAE0C0Y3_9CHLO|nr:hypothetical protein CYMTET_44074 [Cymbomonas tetramitiformis]